MATASFLIRTEAIDTDGNFQPTWPRAVATNPACRELVRAQDLAPAALIRRSAMDEGIGATGGVDK